MNKGEIFYGRKNSNAIHPIVYLSARDEDTFIGAMLTSSKSYDNLLMKEGYIKKNDEKGKLNEFQFKNTHLVQAKLLKKHDWLPFRKIGELTQEGIQFVELSIQKFDKKFWEDYVSTK